MRWVAMCLEECERKAKPIPWDTPGLFPPGQQTFLRLIGLTEEVDAAIFIFSEDDEVWYRGDAAQQPRDNVLIEYGLFAGRLGPHRAIICVNGRPKSSADLHGLTYVDISEGRRNRARTEIEIWAKGLSADPVDPAVLRLLAAVKERETELEETRGRLAFETEKAKEFQQMLAANKLLDLTDFDLSNDGYWKLLFDYRFFWDLSTELSRICDRPSQWRSILEEHGASSVADRLSWSMDEPTRLGVVVRKCLRIFRMDHKAEVFREFVESLKESRSLRIDALAADSISRISIAK